MHFLLIILFFLPHTNMMSSSCNPLIQEGNKITREIDKSENLARTLRKYALYFSMWLEKDLFNGL
jgi:oligoendopeptidase F